MRDGLSLEPERLVKAFWITGPARSELRSEPLADPGPGEALVRTLYSGISRGTESLVLAGRVPPSLHADMRAPFQAGEFSSAVKYGYASVGVVEAGPAELLGRTVFCLYPHQDRYVVPVAALSLVHDVVPARRAVLAANLETAINALWDGAAGIGDRVAVVGAGTVGLCCALLATRLPGVQLQVIDPTPARRELCASLGFDARAPGDARGGCDLVIHASGHAAGLAEALALGGLEATVLELSWYGKGDVPAPLGEAFHARRLRLQSSQVGQVSPAHRPRWSRARRLALALALLDDARFDALLPASGGPDEIPFADLPARLPATLTGLGAPTPLVVYPS